MKYRQCVAHRNYDIIDTKEQHYDYLKASYFYFLRVHFF